MSTQSLKACHCCGQIQWVSRTGKLTLSQCVRCKSTFSQANNSELARSRSAAAAVSALLLFPAAVCLPILEIEKLGHRFHSSILGGIIELSQQGSYFVASVILIFSICLPLLKLLTLFELCWLRWLEHHHRALAFRLVELSGRWSMMDVMLLALLVMLVKLSGMVQFHVGPAVLAFVGCVGLSMLASMFFDPHSIWEEVDANP